MSRKCVAIFAASAVVPVAEFQLGVSVLQDEGFEVTVHPQVYDRHFTYAGTDSQRANALFELAHDDRFDILWAARGGYGAGRLLPILDELTRRHGPPKRKKLLVGYSDVTVLHEFARHRWGWATLHASMPAAMSFAQLKPEEWIATRACALGERTLLPWEQTSLRFVTPPPSEPIEAEITGGNLALWQCLVGTPYAGNAQGKMLFLEDVDERPYRIDRMMTQIAQAGGLENVQAILLGDFTHCDDEPGTCFQPLDTADDPRQLLAVAPTRARIPLRRTFSHDEAIAEIFGSLGKKWGIPVAAGMPVGHGPNFSPLPLGARYRLTHEGTLFLIDWDWWKKNK